MLETYVFILRQEEIVYINKGVMVNTGRASEEWKRFKGREEECWKKASRWMQTKKPEFKETHTIRKIFPAHQRATYHTSEIYSEPREMHQLTQEVVLPKY